MFGTAQKRINAWDIGTNTIKILVAESGAKNGKILQSIEILNPLGFVVPVDNIQLEQMQSLIASIMKEYGLTARDIRLSLPESVVSTQVIDLPQLSTAELSSSIAWQAEQYLPIPNDELVTEYQVLYQPDKKNPNTANDNMRILLIGTRKQVIDNLVTVFRNNGAEPAVMETQTVSLLRQFGLQPEDGNSLIVHMGAASMVIIAVRKGEPVFTISYPEAGNLLTKSLINAFNLPKEQAEVYKVSYGLLEDQGEGKVRKGLEPMIKLMVGNIKSSISFFGSKTGQATLDRIILSGGTAQLPGLVDYVRGETKLETVIVDNFTGMSGMLPDKNQLMYGVSLGLLKR